MINIKDKLQINLITYNRKDKFKQTLEFLLDEISPIKDFDITILDNASTDGTSELIQEYCAKYPNLKHIRHNINIGGNANICRAFEMATKEYLWVLCDDDEFDFSNWNEIQTAINSNQYDMIFTINHLGIPNLEPKIPVVLFWAAFVPAVIYKTRHIDETTMVNMYGTINTWYPHAVPAINILINNNGKFFIPQKNIVNRVSIDEIDGKIFHRGQNFSEVHPDLQRIYWHVGYIKALKLVNNKQKQQELSTSVHFTQDFNQSDLSYLKFMLNYNRSYRDNNSDNYWDIFANVSFKFKLFTLYYICIGQFIKTIQSHFITYENNHKVIKILGIKIKFKKRGK